MYYGTIINWQMKKLEFNTVSITINSHTCGSLVQTTDMGRGGEGERGNGIYMGRVVIEILHLLSANEDKEGPEG